MLSQCWFLRLEGENLAEKMLGQDFEFRMDSLEERKLKRENFEKFGSSGLVMSKFPAESIFS